MQYTQQRRLTIYAIIAIVILSLSAVAWTISLRTPAKSEVAVIVRTASSMSSSTSLSTFSATTSISQYKDGDYEVSRTYRVPNGNSTALYKITVKNDTITSASTSYSGSDSTSRSYISTFDNGFAELKGKKLQDVEEVYVSGASLTSAAFDQALVTLKQKAGA